MVLWFWSVCKSPHGNEELSNSITISWCYGNKPLPVLICQIANSVAKTSTRTSLRSLCVLHMLIATYYSLCVLIIQPQIHSKQVFDLVECWIFCKQSRITIEPKSRFVIIKYCVGKMHLMLTPIAAEWAGFSIAATAHVLSIIRITSMFFYWNSRSSTPICSHLRKQMSLHHIAAYPLRLSNIHAHVTL